MGDHQTSLLPKLDDGDFFGLQQFAGLFEDVGGHGSIL